MAKITICSIEGCGKRIAARTYCGMHLYRHNRGLDMYKEARKLPPRGTTGAVYASALVSETEQCIIWPFARNTEGYAIWHKTEGIAKTSIVSRRICADVYGTPPSLEHHAAHSCGRGADGCINPRHLRWATPDENRADSLALGATLKGDAHPNHKLSDNDIPVIRSAHASGASYADIASRFHVERAAIYKVVKLRTWKHVT